MQKIQKLKIKDNKRIYEELAYCLAPYREKQPVSLLFVVEGTRKKPIIAIRYPGKKLRKRQLRTQRANSIEWANLYDFEVVPYENGKEMQTLNFTFAEMMRDFEQHKRDSKQFWKLLEELYKNNAITKKIPKLNGIDPKLYLLVLKWIWIQEDLNYKLHWKEINSPIKYVLETRTGGRTSRGAGRAKFFAALILVKNYFNFDTVKKIIPLY